MSIFQGKLIVMKTNDNLRYYLAGLLEADGCIYVPYEGINSHIKVNISFHKDDRPLAEYLRNLFNVGLIVERKGEYCVEWSISREEDIFNILTFVNGGFRTPKIVALEKGLNFYKTKYNINIPLLPLDTSPILSNSWLAGFAEGDSSFSLAISKNSKRIISSGNYSRPESLMIDGISPYMAIEVARDYINPVREELGGQSNMGFMQMIASAFNVKVYSCSRIGKNGNKDTFSLKISINRVESFSKLISYFNQYPLYSTKYLNYLDCAQVHSEKIEMKSLGLSLSSRYDKWITIKNNMNTKRDISKINWEHLNNFYELPRTYPIYPNDSFLIRTQTNKLYARFSKLEI